MKKYILVTILFLAGAMPCFAVTLPQAVYHAGDTITATCGVSSDNQNGWNDWLVLFDLDVMGECGAGKAIAHSINCDSTWTIDDSILIPGHTYGINQYWVDFMAPCFNYGWDPNWPSSEPPPGGWGYGYSPPAATFTYLEAPPPPPSTAMSSIISLPASTTLDVLSPLKNITTDIWQLLALAMGLPLAFVIIKNVIALRK
jgi:hypothetical protein